MRFSLSDIDCHQYLDDEEASEKTFRDGYFYPGDTAVKREDGRIRILGRTVDVIVLKGDKFATAPFEQEIQRDLGVDEVCLFSGLSVQGHEQLIIAIQSEREIPKSQLEAVARKFPGFDKVLFSMWKGFPRAETGMRKTYRALLKKRVFDKINADEKRT